MRMDTLLEINQQTQQRRQERLAESQILFDQGWRWLREFILENQDKQKLKQAAEAFAKGIQVQRQHPDNYAGLGFLYYLTGDSVQAVTLLKGALEFDASHLMAQELLQALQRPAQALNSQPQPNRIPGAADRPAQSEQLYERVRFGIFQALKQIMKDQIHQLKPSLNAADFQALLERQRVYQQTIGQLQAQLKVLDQEIDCSDLHRLLLPVEKVLSQIQSLSTAFQAFADFRDRIQATQKQLSELTAALQAAEIPAVLEQRLENLLDQCDGFADRLDTFEAQSWSIEPLKPLYRGFKAQLEMLIELVEEAPEHPPLKAEGQL